MSRNPGAASAWVVFMKPKDAEEEWVATDQVATAAALPGVKVLYDLDGAESGRFHATTSGQTVLYDRSGNLLFSGGITFARGHAGDNAGRAAIERILRGENPIQSKSPVFGCPLLTTRD